MSNPTTKFELSVIIVSYNTRETLRQCLTVLYEELGSLPAEVFVVENASQDGSGDMVEQDFPAVRLLRSEVNLGFGAANNVALEQATGRYFILLNSDAFPEPGAFARAIAHMDATPKCGLGGGLLVGRDGVPQPSARCFHSVTGDAIVMSGLAARYPKSRVFGRVDRTWANEKQPCSVDWVPGAFAIVRPSAVKVVGMFDPAFFLYYEEVDLCLRMKKAGFEVWYWPDVVVMHIGGESSSRTKSLDESSPSRQIVLWRMRSTLLYYRKHHGARVYLARWMEHAIYLGATLRNRWSRNAERKVRLRYYQSMRALIRQAWRETAGGRVSPPRPW